MSARNLRYMQKFAMEFDNDAKLPWSSITTIMDHLKDNKQAKEILKDPYIFDFITIDKDLKELDIEKELTQNIAKLLLELGNGFAFIGRQYHLEIENEDYYIDLLFYNIKIKSYVVIELKTTEFKPEYIGKLNFYLNAIDQYVKEKTDNPYIWNTIM